MADAAVETIDHVHLEVSDRARAARWLETVLGLRTAEAYRFWAEDALGPWFMQTANGANCLALFDRGRAGPGGGDHTVAFRMDGAGFLAFLDRLAALDLHDHRGNPVARDAVADHDQAWSIYFCDPDGNRFEVTTYDYEHCVAALRG